MAQPVEPMDVDCMDSEFDDKENLHSNVLPCTEKGYEELDVSELNMKLRYSASPMSKSYNSSLDNKNPALEETVLLPQNAGLTRSLNLTIGKSDSSKLNKTLPLQSLLTEQDDSNGNISVLRPIDSTGIGNPNITVTVNETHDIDENLSLPSSSSSALHTPEATTPTKGMPKNEEGSPIMRGLKTVLNMFRASQSPIPPSEADSAPLQHEILSPEILNKPEDRTQAVASTPITTHRVKDKETSSKKSSPLKNSIVFNEDLEKELEWKDETKNSEEKIPINKLLLLSKSPDKNVNNTQNIDEGHLNTTVEYMDISYNNSMIKDNVAANVTIQTGNVPVASESDSEFVDCETFTNTKDSIQNTPEIKTRDCSPAKTKEAENSTLIADESLTSIVANISLAAQDGELNEKYNTADYSKETSDILSELSKMSNSINTSDAQDSKNLTDSEIAPQSEEVIKVIDSSVETQEIQSSNIKEVNPIITSDTQDFNLTKNIEIITPITTEFQEPKLDDTKNISLEQTNDSNNVTMPEFTDMCKTIENRVELQKINLNNTKTIITNTENEDVINANNVTHFAEKSMEYSNTESLEPKLDSHDIAKQKLLEDSIDCTEATPQICETPALVITLDTKISKPVETIQDSETEHKNISSSEPITQINEARNEINNGILPSPSFNENSNDTSQSVTESLQNNMTTNNDIQIPEQSITLLIDEPANVPLPDDDDEIDNETQVNEICVTLPPPVDYPDIQILKSTPLNIITPTEITEISNNLKNDDAPIKEESILNVTDSSNVNDETIESKVNHESNDNNKIITGMIVGNSEVSESNTIPESNIESKSKESNIEEKSEMNIPEAEPMDISFNQTQELPDIVNETIIVAKEIVDDVTKEVESMNVEMQLTDSVEKSTDVLPEIISESSGIKSDLDLLDQPKTGEVAINESENEVKSIENQQEHSAIEKKSEMLQNTQTDANMQGECNSIDVPPHALNHEYKQLNTNDEELIVSESNSPYVSLMAGIEATPNENPIEETFEKINDIETTAVLPSSPPITSKGYNFNFDEIDDPFATKTKIRLSPPFDTPNKTVQSEKKDEPDRRKSQPPERKKPLASKKKFNSTFGSSSSKASITKQADIKIEKDDSKIVKNDEAKNKSEISCDDTSGKVQLNELGKNEKCESPLLESIDDAVEFQPTVNEINIKDKPSDEPITANENKPTSSSENSDYYSAGASGHSVSSTESFKAKNVFNLPEIDDSNFNPFATRSKMCQSPTLALEMDPFVPNSKAKSSPDSSETNIVTQDINSTLNTNDISQPIKLDTIDKMETELMEKDTSVNVASTNSSRSTDNGDITTREVHTEDEDTIEGPFDEMVEFDIENTNTQFDDLPTRNQENVDGDELFIDAAAFEFLINQNKNNVVTDSGKESLFLKFDPLFAKRVSSDGVFAALKNIQKRQSTPTKPRTYTTEASLMAGPADGSGTCEDINASQESCDDLNVTVSKPTMVVSPAVNPVVAPKPNTTTTPTRANRHSMTFTSPAIAVIDRLLSMSANNSLVDTTTTALSRDTDSDLALTQLREMLADKEIQVYNLRSESKELKDRLATMETQVKILEADGQDRLKKINDLTDSLAKKTHLNKNMAAVVEEYERTIASLIAETEQDRKRHAEERFRLINERDEQTAHLASMEVSFNDLHSKYEKSKQIILAYKTNEDSYKKSIATFEDNLGKMQANYESLKQHATSKLNHANQELEKMNRAHEAEVVKLNAMIKRKDLDITSLEERLAQKIKANDELTAICDELINKVG